jgi:hypothetical protein
LVLATECCHRFCHIAAQTRCWWEFLRIVKKLLLWRLTVRAALREIVNDLI